MTIAAMLEQSAVLTVIGMSVVFAFLWFLIICMNVTAKLMQKMGWDKDEPPSRNNPSPADASGTAGPEITAAITAAVTEYRKVEEARHE
jgi:oxaloacetate decarboxylase gamma subunit